MDINDGRCQGLGSWSRSLRHGQKQGSILTFLHMTRVFMSPSCGVYTCTLSTARTCEHDAVASLRRMYAYSLWLGEAHTPLVRVCTALDQLDATHVTGVMSMLQTPMQLREKYQHIRHLDWSAWDSAEESKNEDTCAMHAALRYGPMKEALLSEHRDAAIRAFITAIHCREIELHLIMVCWLLRHVGPLPKAEAALPSINHQCDMPWDASYDSLRPLFDALADHVCLLQLSTTLDKSPVSAWQFGSATRQAHIHDERDEAQWFCEDVIGAFFAKSLPAEYGTLRVKCFGPGLFSSPVRRRRWHRTASAPQAPPPTITHESHPILNAERTEKRRPWPSSVRSSNQVHMSRRLVRTQSHTIQPPPPPPARTSKRKRPASRWVSSPVKTLVTETPRHPRPPSLSVIEPMADSDVDDAPLSPSASRLPHDGGNRTASPDSDSDVELFIPAAQKAARKRDPWSLLA